MSAFKGTPGPWIVGRSHLRGSDSPNGAQILAADGSLIARMSATADRSLDEKGANARLIAAAPDGLTAGTDLLHVVKAAIRAGDWKVDGACDPDAAIRRMEQFIAKATGEQS